MIYLINQRMKYVWEGDEFNYLRLFHTDAPINGMPSFTIERTELTSDISIREQKRVYQAVVSVKELRHKDADENNFVYVFQKDKEVGANWLIRDID